MTVKIFTAAVGAAALLLVGAATLNAAPDSWSGIVREAGSEKPLAGVHIQVEGTRLGATTDLEGRFQLAVPPGDSPRLVVSHLGYRPLGHTVDGRDPGELEFRLEPGAFELSPLVVTGTRTPRFVQDAPVRTEVITAADLERRAARNVFEALDASPGVRVEEQCQACNFSQVRMNGLGGDHAQVLLDGLPMFSGLASVYGLQQLTTEQIDRIEIVRGAGSALYGSSAIAGAINIVSRRPSTNAIDMEITGGSYGEQRFKAGAELVQGPSALSLSVLSEHQDAVDRMRDGENSDEVDGPDGVSDRVETTLRSLGASLHRSALLADDDDLVLRLRVLDEFRKGGTLDDNLFSNPYSLGTEHIHTDRVTVGSDYHFRLDGGTELTLQLATIDHQRTATNDTYLGDHLAVHGTEPPVERMRPYEARERSWVGNLSAVHSAGPHRLLAGLQYSWTRLKETGLYMVVDESSPLYGQDYLSRGTKTGRDLGVYLQDEWRLARDWELVVGLRHDRHASEDAYDASAGIDASYEKVRHDETSTNPRLSLKWTPSQNWTLRLSAGTGFKVPFGFSEDLHLCSGSPRVWKGSGLKPEGSRSLGAGIDHVRGPWTLGLAIATTRLLDAVAVSDASPAVAARGYDYEYVNVDDATVLSMDLEASVEARPGLRLAGSLSLFQGEYDKPRGDWEGTDFAEQSRRISRYPELAAGLRIDWERGPWSISTEADYTGAMWIDYAADGEFSNPGSGILETDPFVLLNARVARKLGGQLRAFAGARNLGDYLQPVKRQDDAAFQYGPSVGRTWYAGLGWTL
jgi:outer membrane receptor for ferrienterochelin and colicins